MLLASDLNRERQISSRSSHERVSVLDLRTSFCDLHEGRHGIIVNAIYTIEITLKFDQTILRHDRTTFANMFSKKDETVTSRKL